MNIHSFNQISRNIDIFALMDYEFVKLIVKRLICNWNDTFPRGTQFQRVQFAQKGGSHASL